MQCFESLNVLVKLLYLKGNKQPFLCGRSLPLECILFDSCLTNFVEQFIKYFWALVKRGKKEIWAEMAHVIH